MYFLELFISGNLPIIIMGMSQPFIVDLTDVYGVSMVFLGRWFDS